jgi:hypothetical protein
MTLSISASVRDGAGRFVSRSGALLTLAYAAVLVVYQLSLNGLVVAVLPVDAEALGATATFPAPTAVYGAVVLAALLATASLTVVTVRTFVADRRDAVPRAFYTRRLAWATANLLVGGVAYGLLVLLGSVMLLVPGVVVYVGLVFYTMYVAVEDESFVAAFRQSWRLVRPEFLRVFVLVAALGLGVALVGAAVGVVVAGVAATAVGTGWAGVVSGVLFGVLALFALAVLSAAFARLRGQTRPDSPLAADG